MASFDEISWRFPFEDLSVESGVLCLHRKSPTSPPYSEGGRIDFRPIDLPDINLGYEQTKPEALSVMFWLPPFQFQGLDALAGRHFAPSEEERAASDGSVYAFSAHNPVDTIEAHFGHPIGDTIPIDLTLRFDFEFEGRIGGVVDHRFQVRLSLEQRWEP